MTYSRSELDNSNLLLGAARGEDLSGEAFDDVHKAAAKAIIKVNSGPCESEEKTGDEQSKGEKHVCVRKHGRKTHEMIHTFAVRVALSHHDAGTSCTNSRSIIF